MRLLLVWVLRDGVFIMAPLLRRRQKYHVPKLSGRKEEARKREAKRITRENIAIMR